MYCRNFFTVYAWVLVILIFLDIVLEIQKYRNINYFNSKKLSNFSLITKENNQIWVKYIPEKRAFIQNITDILIQKIKYTTIPLSKTYIGLPLSHIVLYFLPCCSSTIPYLISHFITLTSFFTAFPILYLFNNGRVFFATKR